MSQDKVVSPADPIVEGYAHKWANLADPRLGAEAIYCTDQFFAAMDRMLKVEPAVFYPDKYDDNGKWMDGWESIRKRGEGHDHCIVRLGAPGVVRAVDIDTSHFTGNFPPAASIDGYYGDGDPGPDAEWVELVPAVSLGADAHHPVEVAEAGPVSHVRLNIYPDGGVARLRVFGEPFCEWQNRPADELYELSAISNGGRIVGYNNSHYGSAFATLMPGRGTSMADGWETRRRREPGNDWLIVELGHPGVIEKIKVDTAHFKGNFPDRCSIQASYMGASTDQSIITQSMFWKTLLPEQKMQAHHIHEFGTDKIGDIGPISHIRFNNIPDGGISRLRLFGKPKKL